MFVCLFLLLFFVVDDDDVVCLFVVFGVCVIKLKAISIAGLWQRCQGLNDPFFFVIVLSRSSSSVLIMKCLDVWVQTA